METIWRSIALLLLAVASAHADVLPEPLASPADNSTSPAMAPTSELFTSLTAYFGLVGYNIVPWAPEQTADLERALNESIKVRGWHGELDTIVLADHCLLPGCSVALRSARTTLPPCP